MLRSLHEAAKAGRVAQKIPRRSYRFVQLVHKVTMDFEEVLLLGNSSRSPLYLILKVSVNACHCILDVFSPKWVVAVGPEL